MDINNNNFKDTFSFKCEEVNYKVNKDKGIVTAIAYFRIKTYEYAVDDFRAVGIAKVNKDAGEIFDIEIGKKIARAKAEKEAFEQFKALTMEYKDRVTKKYIKAQNTLIKMNSYIKNQKEYLKQF